MTKHASIWGREAYLGLYVVECPHVAKILVIGQSNGFFLERGKKNPKKKLLCAQPITLPFDANLCSSDRSTRPKSWVQSVRHKL
jgi:hypothetical protein